MFNGGFILAFDSLRLHIKNLEKTVHLGKLNYSTSRHIIVKAFLFGIIFNTNVRDPVLHF